MTAAIEELTCEWKDDDGKLLTKQLDKVVLTKGAWATLVYLYQDINRASGEFGKPKIRIQRYQKRGGDYRPHSKFNVSSIAQAEKITEVFQKWIDEYADE